MNKITIQTAEVLEILGSAITEFMAWEEVGVGASVIEEGFIIYLN